MVKLSPVWWVLLFFFVWQQIETADDLEKENSKDLI